ncbi:ThiF family adenylyltransferase [uncultured Acetobacteroides sp.]|uniref:ThiF family adenylyltransferase n=1 Tax=uncultured Acetobacteroides sp. TaxID=1760811 RepID=UPI0029F48AF2|nr:ThiF family adenylyltransferase [uncultured Acetobacteroides sp.]
MDKLVDWEKRRFARIMELEGLGPDEITKLKSSRIAVVGLTGVGVSTLLALITTGVSSIKVVDYRTIDEFTLPQGSLFAKGDIGKLKTIAIKEKLINMRLVERVNIKNVEIRASNIDDILDDIEIVIYASYSKEILQLVGDYCQRKDKILVWTTGCNFHSYLLCATGKDVLPLIGKAIADIDAIYKSDYYYPSYVSSISGGAAAAVAINALLGKACSFLRKCDVNTFETEQL